MFKKLFLLLIVIAPMSIFAQEKLAYINANEIFSKMPELKEVESKLAAKQEAIKKQAATIETEYQNKLETFRKDSTTVTESILMDRQAEMETLEKRYKDFIQNSQADIEKEQQSLIMPLQQKMRQAIKDVGDENAYTYIFDASTLLHVSANAVDASKKVKVKLGITD